MRNPKSPMPNPKRIPNLKIQKGALWPRFWSLVLGICLGFGIWSSGFLCPAAPFGFADTNFSRPHFKLTEFPSRVSSDGRGGLLWTSVSGGAVDGADGQRLSRIIRT